MKYIITESQYKRLTEDKDNDFESYLTKRFPKINDLKMERSNNVVSGPHRRYINPENNELYFRVVFRTVPSWKSGVGTSDSDEFIRLYVSPKMYAYIKKYGMNFEYDLMDWFNQTYNENVNSVLKKVMD
jgi:hypothetical protein